MSLLAWLLAMAGCACLARAMDRHQRQFSARPLSPVSRRRLRVLGSGTLAASLAVCVSAWGLPQGLVGGCGVFAAGAAPVLLWLSVRPAPPSSRSRN